MQLVSQNLYLRLMVKSYKRNVVIGTSGRAQADAMRQLKVALLDIL